MVILERLDAADEAAVTTLLHQHHARTGSARAAEILARWEAVHGQFWRVQPPAQ